MMNLLAFTFHLQYLSIDQTGTYTSGLYESLP